MAANLFLAQVYGAPDMFDAEREMLLYTVRLAPGWALEQAAAEAQARLPAPEKLGFDTGRQAVLY